MWYLNFLVLITSTLLVTQNGVESKNSSFSTRIVGGKPANLGQFPYQVLLEVQKKTTHSSSGSLISSDFVVTAAHCLCYFDSKLSSDGQLVEDKSTYVIAHGAYVSLGIIERNYKGNFQRIYAPKKDFIVHSNFDPIHFYNDIALIRLSKPVELNEYVQPIGLPPPDIGSLVGERAIVSGYGKTGDSEDSVSNILRYTSTTIISNEKCSGYKIGHIISTILCTQNHDTGSGACKGDSGGPLVYENKKSGVKYLIGIISCGDESCENNKPDVFTRVSSYVYWIKNHLHVSKTA